MSDLRLVPVATCLVLVGLAAHTPVWSQDGADTADGRRQTVIIADLHLGEGADASTGAWHPTEDFRWQDEFALFLQTIEADSRGATDLVINGDAFELWPSTDDACAPDLPEVGCTEAQAIARLDRVLAAHPAELEALGRFASAGGNRVVFVPGHHDAALLFPAVAQVVVDSVAAPPDRVRVAPRGYWLSDDGLIYAEHGHQLEEAAGYDEWPEPFVDAGGAKALVRTWHERVVHEFYGRTEPRYPIIDNIAQEGLGLKYGLSAEGFEAVDASPGELLRFFLLKMPWTQYRQNLEDEVQPPEWDVRQIRDLGDIFLVESLPRDDAFYAYAAETLEVGRLDLTLGDLTDDQIVAICDHRAVLRRARRRVEQTLTQLPRSAGPPPRECPRQPDTRGGAYSEFFRSRDLTFADYLHATRERLERLDGDARPFAVFVYSHTHLPDRGFSPTQEGWQPEIVNTGAWQRVIYPLHLERTREAQGLPEQDMLRALQPEDLPPCYAFVRLAPYADVPDPSLRYWRRGDGGEWEIAAACREGY